MRKITSSIIAGAMVLSFAGAALAVTDSELDVATSVTVDASISLTGVPAAIAFGNGVPGDLVSDGFTANVETNNSAGYKLEVTTSDMSGTGLNADTIPASDLSYNGASPADDLTALELANVTERSAEGGDSILIDVELTIPFVNTDTYSGTADFIASTL